MINLLYWANRASNQVADIAAKFTLNFNRFSFSEYDDISCLASIANRLLLDCPKDILAL